MNVSSRARRELLLFTLTIAAVTVPLVPTRAQDIASGYVYTSLVSFGEDTLGESPTGPVTVDRDGSIIGATPEGDYRRAFYGTLYRYNIRTRKCAVLLTFDERVTRGINPEASVLLGSNGDLYGTTATGGIGKQHSKLDGGSGTLYSYNPSTRKYATLVNFGTPKAPGYGLPRGVIRGKDGCLYGTTIYGGKGDKDDSGEGGTLFRYDPKTRLCTTLIHFGTPGIPGSEPDGELIQGSDGNLYGTTTRGGDKTYYGTLYQYNPVTHQYRTMIQFGTPEVPGREPHGNLIQGKDGFLYGTTVSGGIGKNTGEYRFGVGTLYRYNPSTSVYQTLVHFGTDGISGYSPLAGVTATSDGSLYGTTQFGGIGKNKKDDIHPNGDSGGGTIYRYDPTNQTYATIVNFGTARAFGYQPQSGLTLSKDNSLYGTTRHGEKPGAALSSFLGTLFRLKLPGY